jgi:hypothetical protein
VKFGLKCPGIRPWRRKKEEDKQETNSPTGRRKKEEDKQETREGEGHAGADS